MKSDFLNQNENPSQNDFSSQTAQAGSQNKIPQKSNKKIWFFIIILLVILLGGGIIYLYYSSKQRPESSINQQTATQSPTTTSQASKGLVNIDEIGCHGQDLFIMSPQSGKTPIGKDGNYEALFSTEVAQLVYVTNGNLACASAISLPKYQNRVFFDAKSTAKAIIFQTIGILTTDPAEAESRLTMIENLTSFPAFYAYVKENLPKSDLSSLIKNSTLNSVAEKCVMEMAQKLNKLPANQ